MTVLDGSDTASGVVIHRLQGMY